jgi:DNA replication and repair protein RecF
MALQRLSLRNFRNHAQLQQDFSSGLNVLVGPNGIGKSNIIEAIGLLASCKSFRNADYLQLIQQQAQFALVQGELADKRLKVIISTTGRQYWLDQNRLPSSSEFIGLFPALVFSPLDLEFVSGSPRSRRRFLDSELCKTDRDYIRLLSEYLKLLKDRNVVLKQVVVNEDLLGTIDERMIQLMLVISRKRIDYLQAINQRLKAKLGQLLLQPKGTRLVYLSGCNQLEAKDLVTQLQNYRRRDILTKQSNFGVHRDDYLLTYGENAVEGYCSQGQTRLLMLSLKLVLGDLIKASSGQSPTLLLDDVLSELDLTHQQRLLQLISQADQTIISTTHLSGDLNKLNPQLIEL